MAYKDKEKQKEYQRKWMQDKRDKFMENKSCNSCPSKNNLTLVNIKSKGKKFSMSYSNEKLTEKLNNALILCDSCYLLYDTKRKSESSTTHGKTNTGTYTTWRCMIERCYNPSKDNFKWYGGRGVEVDERWHKFENFYEDMGDRPPGLTLDRKNPEGNYTKDNCKWATSSEQGKNKRKKLAA